MKEVYVANSEHELACVRSRLLDYLEETRKEWAFYITLGEIIEGIDSGRMSLLVAPNKMSICQPETFSTGHLQLNVLWSGGCKDEAYLPEMLEILRGIASTLQVDRIRINSCRELSKLLLASGFRCSNIELMEDLK